MVPCIDPAAAIAAGSGIIISGSGTPGDPWVISTVNPVAIEDIENDIANIQAALLTLPSTYVELAGDTMTGSLRAPHVRLRSTVSELPFLDFYDMAGTVRLGYIQVNTGSVPGLNINADSAPIVFRTSTAERARIDTSGIFVGKQVLDSGATTGLELWTGGTVTATRTASGSNFLSNKISTADVDGAIHFQISSAGTMIGKIYRVTSSTVAILSTSDADLKENFTEIDDDLALLWLRLVQPTFFNFKVDPGVTHVGYSAQATHEMWPNGAHAGVVSPGHGDVEDRTWDEDGNETTPKEVWEPWMMGHGELGPFLHAAVQAIDNKVESRGVVLEDHETRITVLETASPVELEPRVTALEATVADQAAIIASLEARLTAVEASSSDTVTDVDLLRDEVYYTRQMTAGWQFSNTTTTPPGAGQIRTNVPLTHLYIHKTDTDGYDRKAAFGFLVAATATRADSVRFRIRGTSGSVFEVRSSGAAVDNGTWCSVPVTIISGNADTKGFRTEITMLSEIWAEDPPPRPTLLPVLPPEPDSGSGE